MHWWNFCINDIFRKSFTTNQTTFQKFSKHHNNLDLNIYRNEIKKWLSYLIITHKTETNFYHKFNFIYVHCTLYIIYSIHILENLHAENHELCYIIHKNLKTYICNSARNRIFATATKPYRMTIMMFIMMMIWKIFFTRQTFTYLWIFLCFILFHLSCYQLYHPFLWAKEHNELYVKKRSLQKFGHICYLYVWFVTRVYDSLNLIKSNIKNQTPESLIYPQNYRLHIPCYWCMFHWVKH